MFYNLEQSRFVLDPHNTINIFLVYITTVYCWNYITYLHRKRVISPIASPFFWFLYLNLNAVVNIIYCLT